MIWLAGHLNAYAYHAPKDYPDFEDIFEDILPEEPGDEELSDEELAMECAAKGLRPPD